MTAQPQRPEPAAQVRHLALRLPHPRSRHRAPSPALVDVSVTVPRGSVTALVGTNGAGKTTTLRALTGALRPDRGSIEVLGRPVGGAIEGCPPGVELVPDAPLLPGEWTARDVIALRSALGDRFDADAFQQMLREEGLSPRVMIGELSAGQATLFSLAGALAAGPELLVLDEPLARLDPLGRSRLIDRLRDALAEDESVAVLLSTHDLLEMDRFLDRIAILDAGRTVLEGSMEELLEEHVLADIGHEDLVPAEEAPHLPAGTSMRRPTLAELVDRTLAAGSRGPAADSRHRTEEDRP